MADRNGRIGSTEAQKSRGVPFKYDIRVTGDLFGDKRDNGSTTKVSVKILGNEEGEIVVEQEDSRSLASPTSSIDGEVRNPEFTSKRASNGGLEFHIRALPIRPKTANPAMSTKISGGGGLSNGITGSPIERHQLDAPSRLRSVRSFASSPVSRASTRMSEYTSLRPESSGQSLMEIRPAFDDDAMTDCGGDDQQRDMGTQTPQSIGISASPDLVGGGASGAGRRPQAAVDLHPQTASITAMEDKSTMTTWRGIPGELRSANPSRISLSASADDPNYDSESGKESLPDTVLRGGGAPRPAEDSSVFLAFNGPPVAPPEGRSSRRTSPRPKSLPRESNKYAQLRPRRKAKDKINYRERAEQLLTQYFPEEVLKRYLDELRRRYRFMGNGGMTPSEITRFLDETTADSQLKEQLRASLEELANAEMADSSSDYESTLPSSSPSQTPYLGTRNTEMRSSMNDRSSVSPAPKSVRSVAPSSILVGGGMSMEDLDRESANVPPYNTLRSDQMSVAASVLPAESMRNGMMQSVQGTPRMKPYDKPTTPMPPSRHDNVIARPQSKVGVSQTAVLQSQPQLSSTPMPPSRHDSPISRPQSIAGGPLRIASPQPQPRSTQQQPQSRPQPRPQSQYESQPHARPQPQPRPQSQYEPQPRSQPQPQAQSRPQQSSGPSAASSAQQTRSNPQPSNPQPSNQQSGGPGKVDPGYWDDNDRYRMRPPDMGNAFSILKSQPIFVRQMPSSDIKFKSPFNQQHKGPVDPSSPASGSGPSGGTQGKSSISETDAFAERHPAESKVAKAVSELEEVLRRTEAETLAAIESDFHSSTSSNKCSSPAPSSNFSSHRNGEFFNDVESVHSSNSLVGGGASSRSGSVSTHISGIGSKLGNARPMSKSGMSVAQSTVRAETLLKEGMEYRDAVIFDDDMADADHEEEAVVPVDHELRNESDISLPIDFEDMSPELAAVLMRTGGVENSKLRRTDNSSSAVNPSSNRAELVSRSDLRVPSQASLHTRESQASRMSRVNLAQEPLARASVRSSATTAQSVNRSITELDIVMGRTASAVNRSSAASRISAASSNNILRGGSGSSNASDSTRDLDNELANVMRRTSGYAPSTISSYASSVASSDRPDSAASDLKSVISPEPLRPISVATSMRPTYGYAGPGARDQSPMSTSRNAAVSPVRSAVRSPVNRQPASATAAYAPSPLRGAGYQPSIRDSPAPSIRTQSTPPQQQQQRQHQRQPSVQEYPREYQQRPQQSQPPAKDYSREYHQQQQPPQQQQRQQQPTQQQQRQQQPPQQQQRQQQPTQQQQQQWKAPPQQQWQTPPQQQWQAPPQQQRQAPPREYEREHQQEQGESDEQQAQSEREPSPFLFRAPTPVFGRFPSPPLYIKNRGKMPAGEEGDAENEEEQHQQQQQRQPPPPPLQRGPSRNRAQSQSIHQEPPRAPMRNYDEEPVVERLDLETGSISKRRGHARNGSEFGSASTLMNANARDDYDLPKVVEEDVDSLASYSSLRRPHSPNLVGGGRKHPSTKADKEPFTLRGGGRKHPAFDEPAPTKACEAGCCGVCGEGVNKSDVVVRPQVMHASCLRCEACDCLLTSSTFRAIDGHVYCEADYQRFFDHGESSSKAVATRPKMSDKKFQDMNRAIMESFTSVDDFLLHMRQLRQAGDQTPPSTGVPYAGDKSKVQRAGDMGVDRQTHYEREQVTSPMGTPWITERVVDKKVKTKILEKRYPASAAVASAAEPSAPSVTAPTVTTNNEPTLVGGGAPRSISKISRMDDMRVSNVSSASRPATSLLNDTKSVNGWEHPLCPGCNHVVYLNDRVVHESYGYHKACMRCHQCSQVVPATSAIRIKGALYCKKHGTELMRRRSILMRKKSTMGKRSRQTSSRPGISLDRFSPEVPVDKPQPPMPNMPSMPMYSGNNSNELPAPPGINGGPRRVTTALRNFLEAAAEQIENQSLLPVSPEPTMDRPPASRAPAFVEAPKARRPLPLPQPKSKAKAAPPQMHFVQRPVSRSIFAGSGESLYDPNVVNALRQEAQRQINGSQVSVSAPTSPIEKSHRMLSPCGPSIADALQKYATSGRDGRDGRMSVSSQFDPFTEGSQYPLSSLASPQQKQGGDFPPNAQLDNLERRFRNANFRPPWALKSQTMFE